MQTKLMSKSIIALTAAVLVGAGSLSPAFAATKTRAQVQAAPQAQQMPADAYNRYDSRSWSNARASANPDFGGPGGRCITDEGYGRWSYCDGGSN